MESQYYRELFSMIPWILLIALIITFLTIANHSVSLQIFELRKVKAKRKFQGIMHFVVIYRSDFLK
jgi:hypothetical protein